MKSINNHFRRTLPAVLMLTLVLSTLGCMREEKAPPKSMDQLRKENGVPVKTKAISLSPLSKSLSFFATLKGIKESIQGSSVGDKILKINAKVGDFVRQGQIVVEFPSDVPKLRYKQAEIALSTIEKSYNRMKNLLAAGDVSQQQFDQIETQFLVNKENFDALNRALFVESPIDGTITDIFVNEGDIIVSEMPGKPTPLFKVSQLDRMIAKIWITDDEIRNVRKGMRATIDLNDYSSNINDNVSNINDKSSGGNDNIITGKVTDIALSQDKRHQAFGVEITFPNKRRLLKSGTTMEIQLRTYNNPEAITIQRNLINTHSGRSYVYIADNGIAIKRFISTGNSSGMDIEVTDGLNVGDKLITEGASMVDDGTKINIVN